MASDFNICLGTAGWGVWHSPDAGRSWVRHRAPFPLNSRIQALVPHPAEPRTVFAAGDTGIFQSRDGGARWERLGEPDALPTVWSLAVDPIDPRTLLAGTRPSGVHRSRDGGATWTRLAAPVAEECRIGAAFVTSLVIDPDDPRTVWAGVEIDGVLRSCDGGDTWARVEAGLHDPDIHAMAVAQSCPKRLFASTASELFISADLGDTWEAIDVKARWPLPYARGLAVKPDEPDVIFAGCGETTTGATGHVLRSPDGGRTWEALALPGPANATVWGLATHPADGRRVVAFTLFGEVYVSEDAGDSWRKVDRAFGEIRTACWLPA